MRKRIPYLGFATVMLMLFAMSCEKNSLFSDGAKLAGDREQDNKLLAELYDEIDSLSNLHHCNNPKDWNFTAIGSKACGGPTGYIPYSSKLDTNAFLKKVANFTKLQQAYNKKWGVISDCMYLTPPSRVTCQNGKPKLVWSEPSRHF